MGQKSSDHSQSIPVDVPEINTEDALDSVIESILFVMGDPISLSDLSRATNRPKADILASLKRLEKKYQSADSGIHLVYVKSSVQLATKPASYPYIIRLNSKLKSPKITEAMLEVLSIIAYRQPVTRTDIENIRGVSCTFLINKLLDLNLIRELGVTRDSAHAILFGTTDEFLRAFGIRNLSDLPKFKEGDYRQLAEQVESTNITL